MLRARRFLVGVALTGLVAGVLARFFVWPTTASAASAESSDAVVVLAGAAATRLPVAVDLADRGPGVLVVSAAPGEVNAPARALCAHPGRLTVYCFVPDPLDTRGEARAIGRLVARHGWHRITVVTSTFHVARAGLLIRRCTDAEVLMAQARPAMPARAWVVRVAHEIGGLALAGVEPFC